MSEDNDKAEDLELDAGDRALVDRLRGMPREGDEPDWVMLEAQIRAEVGAGAPRPWWRNWRWIVPIWALATTAAVAVVVTTRAEAPSTPRTVVHAPQRREPEKQVDVRRERASSMWLDGEALDLDTLDDLDEVARDLDDLEDIDDLDGAGGALESDDNAGASVLPVSDLGWVDSLDEGELEIAESWLARKKS